MNLGLVYQLQDRFSEAMTEFRRALKFKPGLVGANFFLGLTIASWARSEGHSLLKSSAPNRTQSPDIWLWLATAQEISGEFQAEVVTSTGRWSCNLRTLIFSTCWDTLTSGWGNKRSLTWRKLLRALPAANMY